MAVHALGTRSDLRIGAETNYDTLPIASKIKKHTFNSCGLAANTPLESSKELGDGSRDDGDHYQGITTVGGDLQQKMEISQIGQMLMLALGAPTTTVVSSDFKHVFKSGNFSLPSFFAEIAHIGLDTPEYIKYGGVMVDALAVEMGDSGPAKVMFTLKGRSEVNEAASRAPSATMFAPTPKYFTKRKGSIKVDGNLLANLNDGSFNFSNGLEVYNTINPDGFIGGIDEGVATASGNMQVRYSGKGTLETASSTETPVEITFGFETVDGTASIEFKFSRVYLPKPNIGIDGPGGIDVSYDWQAAGGSAAMMVVTLINKTASYTL